MMRRRSAWTAAVLLASVLAVSGCGDEPTVPEGAVQLLENQPTRVGELSLVAGNIWDGSIILSVDDGEGPAQNAGLSVGERATVKGREFELVLVHEDSGDAAPGGSRSYAWVLPVG